MFSTTPFASRTSSNASSDSNPSSISQTPSNQDASQTNATNSNQPISNGNESVTRRRRGSSLNVLLNTFGIRQSVNGNNQNDASNVVTSRSGTNDTNSTINLDSTDPSINVNTINSNATTTTANVNNNNIQQAQNNNMLSGTDSSNNLPNSDNYQLPISILLTVPNESGNNGSNNQQRNQTSSGDVITSTILGIYNNSQQAPNSNQANNTTNNAYPSVQRVMSGNANSSDQIFTSNAALRDLRHYIYAADQTNAEELLKLEISESGRKPDMADEEELKRRKDKNGLFSIRLTPFIDGSSSSNPGLFFDPVVRTAGPGSQLIIGRYTERVREAISKIPEQYHPVVFKSKVVSRTHGCLKVDSNGNWYVRDVKSSSGTFLNHQRLSPASTLSKDTVLKDGDILQLGIDFRGGTEEIYRCVKMRVELNKSWKRRANIFNKEALQKMRNLQKLTAGMEEEDCSICLSKIKPCQAIFISPCSHSWHFHCIRRIVMSSYPQFMCPNCRSSCDLEASLESSDDESGSEDNDMELDSSNSSSDTE